MKIISLHNGHDASVTAFEDGVILGHWELERVLNIKHFCGVDHGNEVADVLYDHVLPRLGWEVSDIDQVVFAGKSEWAKTEFTSFVPQYDNFNKDKPYATGAVELRDGSIVSCVAVLHHVNHIAYAYFTSPFTKAVGFSYDGVGDGTSSMAAICWDNKIRITDILSQDNYLQNNGIGLCYSYLGRLFPFLGNDLLATAGKAMGLSSYGVAYDGDIYDVCMEMITEWMPDPNKYKARLEELGIHLPNLNNPMSAQAHNLMATIQKCLEDYLCETIQYLFEQSEPFLGDTKDLVMAGGCALNVQANSRLYEEGVVDSLYVPPATSDCGVSIGAGLYVWHNVLDNPFVGMKWHSPYLGDTLYNAPPKWAPHITRDYTPCDVERDDFIKRMAVEYPELIAYPFRSEEEMVRTTAEVLRDGSIVAWAQGRCEIGPRALGNRSILCSTAPTQDDWQDVWYEGKGTFKETINEAIKHREFWRPFAPIGLEDDAFKYFDIDHEQPYMLEAPMAKDFHLNDEPDYKGDPRKLMWHDLAATIHVDGTGRIQTVSEENNQLMHDLLTKYKSLTGVGILLNTSLNDAGIPINNRLEDILNLLRDTQVDYAVVGNWIFRKK